MLEALVTLKGGDAASVGRERIRLLEAVGREGSIMAGARAVGLTYKAAWDGLQATSALFGKPLLARRVGGRGGGGASLTPAGRRVIAIFARLEAELAKGARALDLEITRDVSDFGTGLLVRTSARNAYRGLVAAIDDHALTADIAMTIGDDLTILAKVTSASRRDLGLAVGRQAVALIKASFVEIAADGAATGPNAFRGEVISCATSGPDAEVVLDIGAGRTLAATLPAARVAALCIAPGQVRRAFVAPSRVLLAVD